MVLRDALETFDRYCVDAVEVLACWREHTGPFYVPCPVCMGGDTLHLDADGCSLDLSTMAVCGCGGTGWKVCVSLADSPWVVDSFTLDLLALHEVWTA